MRRIEISAERNATTGETIYIPVINGKPVVGQEWFFSKASAELWVQATNKLRELQEAFSQRKDIKCLRQQQIDAYVQSRKEAPR